MPFLSTLGAASAKNFGFSRRKAGSAGQISYTTGGTYTFTVPAGASKMSVVYINAGVDGQTNSFYCPAVVCYCCCTGITRRYSEAAGAAGGAGGRLYYKNCITVTDGQQFTVIVGGSNGAGSCVRYASNSVTVGYTAYYNGGSGGGGGYAIGAQYASLTAYGGDGGGAGGYTGAGANGGNNSQFGPSTSLYGTSPGGGSSAGGGGRGAGIVTNNNYSASGGASGGVRIVWTYTGGPTRSFPSTNVGDL